MAQTQRNRKTAQENMDDVKSISETKIEPLVAEEPKELNMEQKVTVRSIANWTTGFQRIETNGDVTIPANGTARLSRSEIISLRFATAPLSGSNQKLAATATIASAATSATAEQNDNP